MAIRREESEEITGNPRAFSIHSFPVIYDRSFIGTRRSYHSLSVCLPLMRNQLSSNSKVVVLKGSRLFANAEKVNGELRKLLMQIDQIKESLAPSSKASSNANASAFKGNISTNTPPPSVQSMMRL